ncbi:hypothetical protein AKH13_15150 [Vibrio parahaemolyticus]|nr:hypothetical protein AKH13_15150 [Vibrio parahaemolyticus]OCP95102.1 hypothetical protein AKH14_19880 [Vibrio parahaemolyticus]
MTPSEKERFYALYQQHLTQLKPQGKRKKQFQYTLLLYDVSLPPMTPNRLKIHKKINLSRKAVN